MSRTRTDCEGFHRRDFLRVGAAGLLGLGAARRCSGCEDGRAPTRRPRKKPATGVIQIWLSGGPATIDMWDLKPDAPEEIRGEFRPIETAAPGVSISEHMPGLAKVMDHCALVRSLGHTITAHGPGTTYMATGNRPSAALEYPALGSLAARVLPSRQGVPPYVTFAAMREGVADGRRGLPRSGVRPVRGRGRARPGCPRGARRVAAERVSRSATWRTATPCEPGSTAACARSTSTDVMAGLDRFHRQALEILRSDRVRSALDLAREPDRLRDDYGRSPLGQGALAARRLIEAGARFVTLGVGGWDTHGDNFRTLRDRLLPPLDQALSALIRDLSRGACWTRRSSSAPASSAGRLGSTAPPGATTGRGRWPCSWPAAGFPADPSSARPTRTAWPPPQTPAPPTTWPPRSSSGWASALATRSPPPAAGRSRSSARGMASSLS